MVLGNNLGNNQTRYSFVSALQMQLDLTVPILFLQVQIKKVLEADMTSRLRSWSVAEAKVDYMFPDYRCTIQSLEILLSNLVGV